MNNLDKLKKHITASVIDGDGGNLNQMLLDLGAVGDPLLNKVSYGNDYWYCKIEMFVDGDGVKFEVKSNNVDTPVEAVYDCIKKIVTSLEKMGGNI